MLSLYALWRASSHWSICTLIPRLAIQSVLLGKGLGLGRGGKGLGLIGLGLTLGLGLGLALGLGEGERLVQAGLSGDA